MLTLLPGVSAFSYLLLEATLLVAWMPCTCSRCVRLCKRDLAKMSSCRKKFNEVGSLKSTQRSLQLLCKSHGLRHIHFPTCFDPKADDLITKEAKESKIC